ncbi:MAG: hypothetical protein ACP5M4_11040 [Acidobacteriaceae bacterium]
MLFANSCEKCNLSLFASLLLTPTLLLAQTKPTRPATPPPIPNAATLLREVVAHQRQMDAIRENYTYREQQVIQKLDSHGHIQSTKTSDFRVFFVHTHEINELIGKDGHPLSPGEQRKQEKTVQRLIAQAQKTPPGQSTSGPTVSISQLLAIMQLSSPTRTTLDGRPTLLFHFTGNHHASVHGKAEKTLRNLAGTIWIDEHDLQVRRLDALFDSNLHIGWGIFTVDKGSTFSFTQRPMHGGLWLPANTHVHLIAHAIAFIGYRANITITASDYKVFHATAIQLPGVAHVPATTPQK